MKNKTKCALPKCKTRFVPKGKRKFCSNACKMKNYRNVLTVRKRYESRLVLEKEMNEPLLELREKWNVEPGQVWALGKHKIICCDSLNQTMMKTLLRGENISMVWSDPPYGQNYNSIQKRGKITKSISRPLVIGDDSNKTAMTAFNLYRTFDATQIWWGSNFYTEVLPASHCWIVWNKENGTNDFADCELAWCSVKSPIRYFSHRWNGMIKASERGEKRVHPTQKPVALAKWFFEKFGQSNDTILDPFLGSGISVIAAESLGDGRKVIGFELSPHYIAVILQRYYNFTGSLPILKEKYTCCQTSD